jgi:hypothetical protein
MIKLIGVSEVKAVTVAERSEARTVFARADAGPRSVHGCLLFVLCVRFSVFVYR